MADKDTGCSLSEKASWSDRALKLLDDLNNFSRSNSSKSACLPLIVCGQNVGILQPKVVESLKDYPETFNMIYDEKDCSKCTAVKLNPELTSYESRSDAVRAVVQSLTKNDSFETLRYWRHEDYVVAFGPSQPALFQVERAATSLFGVRAYGAHMNGYVRHPEKGVCVWIARRSSTKQTFPGMLDNLAAGGVGVGFGIRETMIKECYEEAGIPENIAKNVVSVDCISYIYENSRGVNFELEYCFDLELPLDFNPTALDGEVQEFMLCDVNEVKELIVQGNFKPNSAAITLQFLIRHGFLTPDNEPKYCQIIQSMHNKFE